MNTCCNKFNQSECAKGYVMLPWITVHVCNYCGDATSTASPFWDWVFVNLLSPFWGGKIYITDAGKLEVEDGR